MGEQVIVEKSMQSCIKTKNCDVKGNAANLPNVQKQKYSFDIIKWCAHY